MLAHIFYNLFGVRPYMNIPTNNFSLNWFEGDFELKAFDHDLVSMYQSLVHIKHHCLSILINA
jgi:hypothetical protein